MKIKSYRHIIYLGLGFAATLAAYLWLVNSGQFNVLKIWSQGNVLTFVIILFFLKAAGIVWPPIPGGLLTIGAIAFIPWWQAYLIDFGGSIVGSSIAYFLARRWGAKFVAKIFDAELVDKIRSVKVAPHHEIESIFVFRLFGGTIVELICYAAGLLRVRYRSFLIAMTASHAAVGVPVFYFAESVAHGRSVVVSIALLLILVFLFRYLKRRYFVSY